LILGGDLISVSDVRYFDSDPKVLVDGMSCIHKGLLGSQQLPQKY